MTGHTNHRSNPFERPPAPEGKRYAVDVATATADWWPAESPTTTMEEPTAINVTTPNNTGFTSQLYADVAALIEHGPIAPPTPTVGLRRDGIGLFYQGQVNSLVGDPESGKTWLALCTAADELTLGRNVLVVDLDHNTAAGTVSRFQQMGVPADVLTDPSRFRYTEPDDATEIDGVIRDAQTWRPHFVIIDSLGELLPIYGANSNSADDFTRVHATAIKPFAAAGAAVCTIDHLAKGADSRSYGATGTAAKKRAIGGAMLRVSVVDPFTPGVGGRAEVTIAKDRHGGLRAECPPGREPLAAKFRLRDRDGALDWFIDAPEPGETPSVSTVRPSASRTLHDDVAALDALDEPPRSKTDVARRMGWGNDRAMEALRAWRDVHGVNASDGFLRPV